MIAPFNNKLKTLDSSSLRSLEAFEEMKGFSPQMSDVEP